MKVLFVQPSLQPPGGGNGVAVWMLQSLVKRAEVTVLSWVPLALEAVDAYYGTRLADAGLKSLCRRPLVSYWLERLGVPHELFKLHYLMAHARRLGPGYDLVCSANNELDLGGRAVQYVHYPWNSHPRPDCHPDWYSRRTLRMVLHIYYALCTRMSGYSREGMLSNLTLVNSDWTGRLFQRTYGPAAYRVLHPPALGRFPRVPWKPRRNAFLSIGRQCPTKEWEKLITIVAGLRARGHEVELTLAGSRDNGPYRERILERIRQEGPWVSLAEDLSREELVALATEHRYGLHGMVEEHYGMAVAELVLAGCLPFAPADGGQVEILRDDRLLYASAQEAVEKIDRVLGNEELQRELLAQLAGRDLGVERFQRELEECLRAFLQEDSARPVSNFPG